MHKILYDSHTRGFITQRCNRGCGFFVRSGRLQSRELHFDAGASAQQVIHNYYKHTSSAASCLEHVESQQVPNNKSSLLRTDIIRMQQLLRAQSYDRMPNVHCLTVPGPHYYIIGLRKIII